MTAMVDDERLARACAARQSHWPRDRAIVPRARGTHPRAGAGKRGAGRTPLARDPAACGRRGAVDEPL